MALVRNAGQTSIYFQDIGNGGSLQTFNFGSGGPNAPSGIFSVRPFNGVSDNVRVFTFQPGSFTPDDLLISQVVPNAPPIAVAGDPQSIHVGQLINLNGIGSYDAETLTEDLIYNWAFDLVPAGSTAVFDLTVPIEPTFVADLPGDYVISLVVTDEGGLSSDPSLLTVSSNNAPPSANAGPDKGTYIDSTVVLDGSNSSDPDSDPIASYSWSFVNRPVGSSAIMSGAGSASPSFIPDLIGAYTLQLIVNDGYADSVPDTVTIVVVTTEEFAEVQTMEVLNLISVLPINRVTNSGNQTALENMLLQVIESLQDVPADLQKAQKKLQDALERTDGCTLRGAPDINGGGNSPKADTITNCTDQDVIYPLLVDALNAILP